MKTTYEIDSKNYKFNNNLKTKSEQEIIREIY